MEEKIKQDLKGAQLEKDEVKVSTLRLLLSEIHNLQIQKGQNLGDDDVISVIQKEVKKRKEAAEAFEKAGRVESAEKEKSELGVLQSYLPQQLTNEELTKIVEESITKLGATTLSDTGKVIGMVMGQVGSRADGGVVSSLVREKLSS